MNLNGRSRFVVLACSLSVAACGVVPTPNPDNPHGHFLGRVVASWNDDGRTMELQEAYAYVDPDGQAWAAPKGSQIDGASIPQAAWSIVGGPFEGKYRNASVVHDVACAVRSRTWQSTHLAFYLGMRASQVDEDTAKLLYAAVYHYGPRWPDPGKSIVGPRPVQVSRPMTRQDAERLRRRIETEKPTLEEIQSFEPPGAA